MEVMLGRDGALSILKPYQEDLVFCIQSGFEDYFQKYSSFLWEHSRRSKTSMIYDLIISHVRQRFSDKKDIKIIEDQNETAFLVIKGKLVLRFKKFRMNSKTANVITKENLRFRGQEQMELFPNSIHLYAGYLPDEAFRKIDRILITCPNYYGNSWEYPMIADEITKSIIPMSLNEKVGKVPVAKITLKTKEKNAAAS